MKCKDVERWIIAVSEESPEEGKLSQVEEHIVNCPGCARFEEDLKKIRLHIQKTKAPVLSEELIHRTRLMCHAAMKASSPTEKSFISRIKAASIPVYIWIALVSLVVLTVILMLPLLKELAAEDLLSLQAVVTLSLMIQNAVMLFFAPLILRKFRGKSHRLNMV